jgi:hypothetical protein
MKQLSIAAMVLSSVLSSPTLFADSHSVVRVEIRSTWAGLGFAPASSFVIQKSGAVYRRGHDQIDARLVEALASALEESPLSRPILLNLGVTDAWLRTALTYVTGKDLSWKTATADQKQLFISSFSDAASVTTVLPSLYNFVRTDDYPSIQVELTFADGSHTSVSSHTPYQFMLPWKVDRSESIITYNANISRAIAALMPMQTTNRTRLVGEGLASDLADAVSQEIKEQWNLLGVEDKAGDTLNLLRSQYTVETADINQYHSVDYGKAWDRGAPRETNLQVTLRKPGFPSNFSERAVLLYEGGKVFGADLFLHKIGEYETLVESVPWLTRYRDNNPKVLFQLAFVHDRSFSDKAMSVFEADMKGIGKAKLTDEVRTVQDKVALLGAGYGGYWLVLPDRRMIFWRYSARAGLLEWAPSGLATSRCSDYHDVTGGCVGAIVTPDGILTN